MKTDAISSASSSSARWSQAARTNDSLPPHMLSGRDPMKMTNDCDNRLSRPLCVMIERHNVGRSGFSTDGTMTLVPVR